MVGETEMARTQVVSKLWEYIKAHDLQNPSDKREILCDGKLQRVFGQSSVHVFTMNKPVALAAWASARVDARGGGWGRLTRRKADVLQKCACVYFLLLAAPVPSSGFKTHAGMTALRSARYEMSHLR